MVYPINDKLQALLGDTLRDSRWDMPYLGMQVLIEGLALAAFGMIRDTTTKPLPKQILAYVMQDEARHVAFGRMALRDYYKQLGDAELREREEFVIEGCYLMRDRLRGVRGAGELRHRRRSEAEELTDSSEYMQLFQSLLFSRIVPCVKDIGLWGDKAPAGVRRHGRVRAGRRRPRPADGARTRRSPTQLDARTLRRRGDRAPGRGGRRDRRDRGVLTGRPSAAPARSCETCPLGALPKGRSRRLANEAGVSRWGRWWRGGWRGLRRRFPGRRGRRGRRRRGPGRRGRRGRGRRRRRWCRRGRRRSRSGGIGSQQARWRHRSRRRRGQQGGDHGDQHHRGQRGEAGGGPGHDAAPVPDPLRAPAGSQLRRQHGALRGEAVDRRRGQAERGNDEQRGQQRPAICVHSGQCGDDPDQTEQRQRASRPSSPAATWHHRGVLGRSSACAGTRPASRNSPCTDARATTSDVDCQIKNAPSASRQEAPVPRRSSATARSSPARPAAGTVATRNADSLRNSRPPPSARLTAPASRNEEEHQAEQVPVPLQGAGQVGPALAEADLVPASAAGQQRTPVHAQDLDAAEAPPEPLALERLEGQRHDAVAERLVDVQPGPARPAAAAATARRPR